VCLITLQSAENAFLARKRLLDLLVRGVENIGMDFVLSNWATFLEKYRGEHGCVAQEFIHPGILFGQSTEANGQIIKV
jgi:hypothetical protein